MQLYLRIETHTKNRITSVRVLSRMLTDSTPRCVAALSTPLLDFIIKL